MKYKQKGFTLIELMIVIAIIGVIAAIGVPTYNSYVQKTKRNEVKVELERLAQAIQNYKLTYKRYNQIPLAESFLLLPNGTKSFPQTANATYTITVAPIRTATDNANTTVDESQGLLGGRNWTLTATPTGSMTGNGNLMLNAQGYKCWTKTGCTTPTATSKWKK